MYFIIGAQVTLVLFVLTFKVWLFGSFTTSAVKSVAGSCGKTYFIEKLPVISGNWFCGSEE